MTVPLRILAALAFALLLLRGAFACEPVQAAATMPAACHHAMQSVSKECAHRGSIPQGGSAACHAGCCVGCGSHCGPLSAMVVFDVGGPQRGAPPVFAETRRASIVRAPLLPPPIV